MNRYHITKITRPDRFFTFTLLIILTLVLFHALSAFALDPNTLPTGGQITSGTGSVSQSGNAMTVNQATDRMIANWNTFNIGQNASVAFQQPGASSVALNRILDQNPTQIYGSLTANGQVFLLNAAGVYFGPTAQVDVGGLVASSLNITNKDFLAGRNIFENTGSAGAILNQGNIRAAGGGYIAFLSPAISNEGTITAHDGTIAMASGDRVSLDFTGDSLVNFTVDQGAIDALIENKGLIRADGGAVILTAKAADTLTNAVVNNSGVIEARTLENRSGRILLLSDMEAGETIAGGTLDASAPNGGDGGFIETSGKKVTIADGLHVTTSAPDGTTGTWLIDPTDFTIAASGGDMTGATISSNLGTTSVTIQSSSGATGTNGDIFVNDNITWSANTLTLNAYRNIEINRELNGSGTAQLSLLYGQGAVAAGNTATYTIRAPVNLPAGNNFFTTLGSDGTLRTYTVITSLGLEGSTTGTDLQGMTGDLAGYYALGDNIDASATSTWSAGAGFAPVGNNTTKFTGAFDGLGHTITDLTINRPPTDYVGLFGYTTRSVSNVGMVGGEVTGHSYVGGLVGWNSGTITNSYATGKVTGGTDLMKFYVGGLVGYNSGGTITNSYATGSVTGAKYVGGLVGYNTGTITNSYSTGKVTGSSNVGGLVGLNYGTITNSYATGKVIGESFIGGLVGYNLGGTITNSYATGEVTGSSNVGGLVGYNSGGTITNSYWDTQTSGRSTSDGGTGLTTAKMMQQANFSGWDFTDTWWMSEGNTRPFLRMEYSTTITNAHQLQLIGMNTTTLAASYTLAADIDMAELSQASGLWNTTKGFVPVGTSATKFTGAFDGLSHTITDLNINRPSTSYVGLFGYIDSSGSVSNVGMVGGAVSASGFYIGGLVGYNSGTITNSYSTGAVTGSGDVGGLVGRNYGTITNSYATGEVDSSGFYIGGLVGYNTGAITNSYATGEVWSFDYIGGLVGYNVGTITNSYATGEAISDVSVAGEYVGGLVGRNYGTITNSYATGKVTGRKYVGGLVGRNYGTITNSYATGEVLGIAYEGGLVGDDGGTGTVTDSFWDTETSGQPTSDGGTGKTTAEMKQLATFSAWDIDNAGGTGKIWRIYDGNTYPLLRNFLTTATATAENTSMVYNRSTTVAGGSYTWDIAVDTSKIYGAAAYTASSKDVGNRTLSLSGLYFLQDGYDIITTSGTVDITAKAMTLSGIIASNKVYDATTAATVNTGSAVYTGIIAGDAVTVSATGLFDTKNVDTGKTVTLTSSYTGADTGNYAITDQAAATADITAKGLTAAYTGTNKVYDTTTTATVTGSSADIIAGDTVTFSQTAGFIDKNVGAGKTVNVSGIAISGTDAGNYALTGTTATTTADITKAPLSITANDDNKIYSGVPYSGGNGVTYAGFVGGETSAVLGGTLQYGGTSQGAINAGTYNIDPSGLTSGNYAIGFVNGVLTIGGSSMTAMEAVNSVLMCTLNTSNGTAVLAGSLNTTGGTQEGQGGNPGTHDVTLMGPGTGSTTLTNFINTTLVAP